MQSVRVIYEAGSYKCIAVYRVTSVNQHDVFANILRKIGSSCYNVNAQNTEQVYIETSRTSKVEK